jgi:uncharacterized membrane protein YfcA
LAEVLKAQRRKRVLLGFSVAIPIGFVGGLIGLGGAEFRLPVLVGPLSYSARRAVPLNLAISLVTLTVALAVRSRELPLSQLVELTPVMLALISSAMLAAFFGAGWTARISNEVLKRTILILLLAIGAALIVEGFLPGEAGGFIPGRVGWQILSGVLFGLAIGLFSSVLGVAGGELIIPTLVYAFGVDIRLAGTASLLISLPTVLVGMFRFARLGGYAQRQDLYETVAPMGAGSVIGAVAGGLMVGIAPAHVLKVFLGLILCYSAWRIFE